MFTEKQIKSIQKWDEQNKTEKDRIKNKFTDALSSLHYLCELPPNESREIMESAIKKYSENINLENRENTTDPIIPDHPRHRQDMFSTTFTKEIIKILLNGVSESNFEKGVNDGVDEAVRWWIGNDDGYAADLYVKMKKECPPFEKGKHHQQIITRRSKLPTKPPIYENDRLTRIFQLHGKHGLTEPGFIDRLVGIIDELDVERIEKINNSIEEYYDNQSDDDFEPHLHDIFPVMKYKRAKEIVNESRKMAEQLAVSINNPKNKKLELSDGSLPRPGFKKELLDWHKRELIELHREYLSNNNKLPDEEQIPEYSNPRPKTPEPPQLDFCNWYYPTNIKITNIPENLENNQSNCLSLYPPQLMPDH